MSCRSLLRFSKKSTSCSLKKITGSIECLPPLAYKGSTSSRTSCRDGSGGGALVASAGLQDDQLGARLLLLEVLDEGVDSLLVIGEGESLALGHQAHLEAFLGDVYPDVVAGSLGVSDAHDGAAPCFSCVPGLADTGSSAAAALAAPATVRAPPSSSLRTGATTLATFRSLRDPGATGLSRPRRPHFTTTITIHGRERN